MANKKISELTAKGTAIAATDLLEISESDGAGGYVTKSVTGANLSTGGGGGTGFGFGAGGQPTASTMTPKGVSGHLSRTSGMPSPSLSSGGGGGSAGPPNCQ